jgi:hypothetical protein
MLLICPGPFDMFFHVAGLASQSTPPSKSRIRTSAELELPLPWCSLYLLSMALDPQCRKPNGRIQSQRLERSVSVAPEASVYQSIA